MMLPKTSPLPRLELLSPQTHGFSALSGGQNKFVIIFSEEELGTGLGVASGDGTFTIFHGECCY